MVTRPRWSGKYNFGTLQTSQKRVTGPNEKAIFLMGLCRVQWEELYRLPSCDQQYNYFQTVISDLMNSCFPTRKISRHTKGKPWVTDRFKLLVHERQRAWAVGDLPRFRRLRNQVNRLRISLRKNFYKQNMTGTPPPPTSRNWWNTVKSLVGSSKIASPIIYGQHLMRR